MRLVIFDSAKQLESMFVLKSILLTLFGCIVKSGCVAHGPKSCNRGANRSLTAGNTCLLTHSGGRKGSESTVYVLAT